MTSRVSTTPTATSSATSSSRASPGASSSSRGPRTRCAGSAATSSCTWPKASGLADEVDAVARRLLHGAAPSRSSWRGLRLEQNASIGVVVWDATSVERGRDHPERRRRAVSRPRARARAATWSSLPTCTTRRVNRFTLAQELRRRSDLGQISMHYQPILELARSRIVGFEALMRWRHPERGPFAPDVFIPLAEQNELIVGARPVRDPRRRRRRGVVVVTGGMRPTSR